MDDKPSPTADALQNGALSLKRIRKLLDRYRVTDGSAFRLKDYDPGDTADLSLDHKDARLLLNGGIERLSELQERLFAQDSWSLLVCFQAMDAAGKDGTIKHVMSGVNPQGVKVTAFKTPGSEELDHDFLWRINNALPERGRIGIFNRSHYEEVLVTRVHPEVLQNERLPAKVISKHFWEDRLAAIANYERYLAQQGVVVVKFYLNLSKAEQKQRFVSRLNTPSKHWKFNPDDLAERRFWDHYMEAYETAVRATAAPHAPWYIVPADHKWFTRLVVVAAIVTALDELDLTFPEREAGDDAAFAAARAELENE